MGGGGEMLIYVLSNPSLKGSRVLSFTILGVKSCEPSGP